MARKDRLNGTPFTCCNKRFQTNINKGHSHRSDKAVAAGSVFDGPVFKANEGPALWLEHVTDKQDDSEVFWFMWYDVDGTPTIPLSGVFGEEELREMSRRLASLIEVR